MAQVGRISGPLLQANLERNGVDLAFRNDLNTTQLLYLDVNNGKIGVNTATPTKELDIAGTTRTTNLIASTSLNTPGFDISGSTFRVLTGDINLNAADAIVMANMENGTIRVSDNIISTIDSNADIDLRPWQEYVIEEGDPYVDALADGLLDASTGVGNAFWQTVLPSGFQRGDLNEDGTINIDDVSAFLSVRRGLTTSGSRYDLAVAAIKASLPTTEIINDLEVFGDIYTPGNITFGGDITIGDNEGNDTVTFQTDIDTSIIPDQTNQFDLGTPEKRWGDLYTFLINGEIAQLDGLETEGINVNLRAGGIIWVDVNGNDNNVGDHPLGAVQTIAEALSRAEASGEQPFTVFVKAGEYQEALPLVVPNNVSIIGEDIRNVIVTPDTSSQSQDVFHLNDNTTITNITVKNHYYDSVNNTGYAFRFAPNAVMSTRSPYVQNVTVLTQETTPGDGDAGRGAWIDGAELNAASPRATMLFHSCTFISPGADVINMTNGVRVEWLNSFTYFANRGLYAFNGATGRTSEDGSTVIYGAELRSIGSANVYGTYGAVADGADTLMYLIQHNFAYIGAGTDRTNDLDLIIQANEVVELNSGQIHYVSTDQVGNFRVGDNFFVNFETGDTSLNIDTAQIDTLSGMTINTPQGTTVIDSAFITTGDILIEDNTIKTNFGNLTLKGGNGTINLKNNTTVSGSVDIVDNLSFGGTLNIAGDQPGRNTEADKLVFNVEFEQNFNPHQDGVHNLGEVQRYWKNAYLGSFETTTIDVTQSKARFESIELDGNSIQSVVSNADLELRAAGTSKILVSDTTVNIVNNLSADNISTANLFVNDTFTSNLYNPGDIEIFQNVITTINSNSDLELRASGTGNILLESDLAVDTDLTVVQDTKLEDAFTGQTFGPELITNGTFDSNITGWSQTGGGLASSSGGQLRINATGSAQNVSQSITVEAGKTYIFKTQFKSVSNSNQFYLRVFESGVGTLQEWNETSGLVNDEIVSYSFVPVSNSIDIIFRAVDTTIFWDNVTVVEDEGINTIYTPVEVNLTGDLSLNGNTTQTGNFNLTGNISSPYTLTGSSDFDTTVISFENSVIRNTQEGLRMSTESTDPASVPVIVQAIVGGATAADYPNQQDKNLINFLLNNNYVDVNQSGSLTTSDYIAWLQYIANGETQGNIYDSFLKTATDAIIAQEYSSQGYFNFIIFNGDYNDPNLEFRASGTGEVLFTNGETRVSNSLFAAQIVANDINVNQDIELNEIVIKDSIIEIDDNFVSTTVSNANLELRAQDNKNIYIPNNNTTIENNLTVNGITNLKDTTIVGNIIHTGTRNQVGNLNVIGNVYASTSNIESEIQFDDISFDDNVIATNESNADLELRANGAGVIAMFDNNVQVDNNIQIGTLTANNININNSLTFEEFELSSDIQLFDNVITTTNSNSNLELRTFDSSNIELQNILVNNATISTTTNDINLANSGLLNINANGALNIPIGSTVDRLGVDSSIRFNTDDSVFEAPGASSVTSFGGIYSDNRQTSILAHPTNNTLSVNILGSEQVTIDATKITAHGLDIDDIFINDNLIRTNISNSSLDLRANGTGKLILDNISIKTDTFTNTVDSAFELNNTLYGKVKFDTTGAVRIPAGTDAERPVAPEIGTTRWNTDIDLLEVWDGSTFITAAGTSATLSAEEMDDLVLEYTLIFG